MTPRYLINFDLSSLERKYSDFLVIGSGIAGLYTSLKLLDKGILEGPVVGAIVGLIFGIYSFLNATNPIFADPLIAILPRIFIGVMAYYSYRLFRKNTLLAAVVGTLTNTIGVLGLATLRGYLPLKASITIAWVHGTPEVVVAALLLIVLVKALKRFAY